MARNYYGITLALVGICQSVRLVQQLAHQRHCDGGTLHASLNSIIDMNPNLTLTAFGGSEANLCVGLETLLSILNASSRQGLNTELAHYTLSLMALERKLSSTRGVFDTLSNRINGLQRQFEYFDLQFEMLISTMAATYIDIISPFGLRIQVADSPAALQSPQVQAKVRVTLLVGIRVAVLWRQVGGSCLQLMFSHNRLTIQVKQTLAHLAPEL